MEHDKQRSTMVDCYAIPRALLWLNVAMIFGHFLDPALAAGGLQRPLFVFCLIGGILIGNTRNLLLKKNEV